ncbi:unnamed protein product [Rotaria sp. Silwood2]|nr:unnamed protein product [Rotaria sp. Silwood2]CAF4588538.1 unnamed protein product [Rotaria sp. Silwood2]
MSTNTLEEIEFLLALQKFTVHCVSNQCSSKIKSYCIDLLIAVTHLPKVYIGHKIQLALALETVSLRNETRLILNDYMNIISHLIYLARSNLNSEEEKKCAKWTGIDLVSLLNQCENRFKKQSYSSTVWIEILNETSMFSIVYSSTQHHLFDLCKRKHGSDRWHNILIITREQIAGYGTDFIKLSSIPSMPLDIAIDLTDGPLILSDVLITFVNHTDRCIPILPEKLTPQHSCYNTS